MSPTVFRIHYTTRALSEIDEQVDYVARTSPTRASLFVDAIFRQIDLPKTHPRIGRVVPETGKEAVRELLFRQYRIIYHVISDAQINILTLQSGRRPLQNFPQS